MQKIHTLNSSATRNQEGFTLLELSIFFVIAAALVLTIFKGKDLIFAYKVQATIKEYQENLTAYRAFKSKYGYFPGDFPYASRIWPDLGDGTGGGGTTYSGDGDGNGFIDEGPFKHGGIQWYVWFMEATYGWGHLSREGLVPGNYKGTPNPRCFDPSGHCKEEGGGYSGNRNTGYYVTADIHAPRVSLPASVPTCDYNYASATIPGGSGMYDESLACRGRPIWMARKHQFLGKDDNGGVYNRESPWSQMRNVFTISSDLRYYGANHIHIFFPTFCSSAQIIDNKIDDGKPFTGTITADWPCRNDRNGCQYGDCYTGKPEDWDYINPSLGDANDVFINFMISEGDI
jgi:hypothetical protein